MEFRIQKKENENIYKYPTEDVQLAQKLADGIRKEFQDFVLAVVVFGSSARQQATSESDIDVLIINDDSTYIITEALIESYRIIVGEVIQKISNRFHITSMTFTSFWDHARNGDPIVTNILRDGIAVLDSGFFDPLQKLLKEGKIRPTRESVWRYFGRAPKTLLNSQWHVLQATLDLYWAVIDSAHAALMRANQIPPSPEHVADLLETTYVNRKLLEKRYVDLMRKFYKLSKDITHRHIQHVSGREFDLCYLEADEFVKRMKKLVENGEF
ncbi:MAG: nucleotidyltransferase domain-containing protein [archaeon]|nr:nucleotidyltransferase domain-containing protein [archaeon]